ncbi:helix-turn-helix transcriptional regulator [Lentzea aerocolonigenes]|uniref:helix-turn-helix transcriptional regulator n=1 Tax=Lentzea aerocolonigenes TaxID=68170 RepID=UPI00055B64F0|nr:LuxR family transcriptional regulator [Lentzea aerocolonigenes]MCP2242189.1 regulatory protein, luxR family [Lentzea aerocolonigenes]
MLNNWDDRADIRACLRTAVSALMAGSGGVVLVEGEVGMGCGRELAFARALAVSRNASTYLARADELARWTPLAVLCQALGETVWGSRPPDLLRSIGDRSGEGPVLIALDHLQWADPMTLFALKSFPSALRDRPVLWLLARRDGIGAATEVERLFDHLESEGATRLRLRPLSAAAVERMLTGFAGRAPDGDLVVLAAGAGGNPTLLTALLDGLREEHGAARGDSAAAWSSRPLPGRVVTVVQRMLSGCEAETISVLEVAAIFGTTFRVADVADVLGRTAGDILRAVREALRARLVVPGDAPDSLSFRYDLVRRVLEESATPSVAAALHRQVGLLLLRRSGSAADAADHLVRGALPGDTKAIRALADAAAQALDTAPTEAAEISLRALRLTRPGSADHHRLLDVRVTALLRLGRLVEAEELASAGLAVAPPEEQGVRLGAALATVRVLNGRYRSAVTVAEQMLVGDASSSDHERVQATRIWALIANGDHQEACRLAEMAVTGGENRAVLTGTARLVLATQRWAEGDVTASFELMKEAMRCGPGGWRDVPTPHPQVAFAAALATVGDIRAAEEAFAEAESLVQHAADVGSDLALRVVGAWVKARSGRVEEAAEVVEAAFELSEELGVTWWTSLMTTVLATAALRRGDPTAARLHLGMAPESRLPFFRAYHVWTALQVEAARTSQGAALSVLAASHPELLEQPAPLLLEPGAAAWLVRAARSADDRDLVRMVVAASAELARRNPGFPSLAAGSAHARGVARGDAAALTAAMDQYTDPWAKASAAEDLAAADGAGAVAALEAAMAGYTAVDSTRDVARIRSKLREAGVRRRHWTYTDRPATGWESLTDTEREVAELVAGGLTNRQVAARMFLSPHTVHAHLGRIFRKLGIASRVELTGLRHRTA